jgi:hypothetical protein
MSVRLSSADSSATAKKTRHHSFNEWLRYNEAEWLAHSRPKGSFARAKLMPAILVEGVES